MASAPLTSAKSFLARRGVLRNAVCLTGILALTVLPNVSSKRYTPLASEVKPTRIEVPGDRSPSLLETLNDSAVSRQRQPLGFNLAISPATQKKASARSRSSKANLEGDIKIVPKIDVHVSAPQLWADGQTPAVVYISLKAVKGDQTWNYEATEELVFQLEPRNALFSPSRVKILPGSDTSEPASLIAKQPIKLQVTCSPERKYAGLAIVTPQTETIEFITPIDAIGIESASATYQVNVAIPFEIFLYNQKDPGKKRLRPRSPISVEVISESGNGKLTKQPVQLTANEFSKFIHYVGTKTGGETIVANASYEGEQIRGMTSREIVFPLWVFLSGFAGSLLGSAVRYYKTTPSERNNAFFESLFYGVVICILLILYPVGTKLPEISNYIQPLLLFALGALVSVYGPQSVHWALSFIPKGAGQENG